MNTYLSIDLGTSNCRSAVFDENMEMLSIAAKEYPLFSISAAQIEQDPLDWWNAVKATIKEAIAKIPDGGKSVCSISISSQGIAFHPIDEKGKPLFNSLSWLDTRAVDEEKLVEEKYGIKKIFDITGKRANGCYTLSKLIWFKNTHADIYEKAYRILLPMDYINFMLCGNPVTDHTMAGGTMFYDINTGCWSDEILNDYGIDKSKLPDLSWSGKNCGTILPEVADELGLSRDVIVAVGAQDQKVAALGAGIGPESATASLGTASCITLLTDKPVKDDKLRVPCFSFLYPGTWSFEGIINTAASSYQWFKKKFADHLSYKELDAEAKICAEKGERAIFYPYLSGMTSPFWGNATGTFTDLSLSSGPGQLALAIMDGVSCNIRANLEVMEESAKRPKELRLFGGGAASPIWCQITADITNMPVVTLASPETALKGAAMLAYHGKHGAFPEIQEETKIYEPNKENVKVYEEYYQRYMEGLKGKY